jgi:hypothetical protein
MVHAQALRHRLSEHGGFGLLTAVVSITHSKVGRYTHVAAYVHVQAKFQCHHSNCFSSTLTVYEAFPDWHRTPNQALQIQSGVAISSPVAPSFDRYGKTLSVTREIRDDRYMVLWL